MQYPFSGAVSDKNGASLLFLINAFKVKNISSIVQVILKTEAFSVLFKSSCVPAAFSKFERNYFHCEKKCKSFVSNIEKTMLSVLKVPIKSLSSVKSPKARARTEIQSLQKSDIICQTIGSFSNFSVSS